MADEAFALSPISARAAQPSEADYEAIREAFMETSRGRWFLGEYAKRNRNADTRMVLDAVARIEETLVGAAAAAATRRRLPKPWPRSGARSTRRPKTASTALDGLGARGQPGAGPQGRPHHQGDLLALARDRRGFAGSAT